jgi:hypothetical protein
VLHDFLAGGRFQLLPRPGQDQKFGQPRLRAAEPLTNTGRPGGHDAAGVLDDPIDVPRRSAPACERCLELVEEWVLATERRLPASVAGLEDFLQLQVSLQRQEGLLPESLRDLPIPPLMVIAFDVLVPHFPR